MQNIIEALMQSEPMQWILNQMNLGPKKISTGPRPLSENSVKYIAPSENLIADVATQYAKSEINAGRSVTYERAISVVKARFRRGLDRGKIRVDRLQKDVQQLNQNIGRLEIDARTGDVAERRAQKAVKYALRHKIPFEKALERTK